jgi:transposase-like protein
MTPEQVRHARALLTEPDATVSSIARLLRVSRSTIYKYVPELATGDRHLGDRTRCLDHQLHGLFLELRREVPTIPRQPSSFPDDPNLSGATVRKARGGSQCSPCDIMALATV